MTTYGGTRAEFWQRNPDSAERRRWPNDGSAPSADDPRDVTFKISSWVGTSPGARHTYLEITEDPNPLWDEADDRWIVPWDDAEGKGRHIKAEVMSEAEAVLLAITFIELCGYAKKGWRLNLYGVGISAEKVIKQHIKKRQK